MYAVTERGVVGLEAHCSIFWLQRLQSSYCPEWSLPGDSEAAGLSRLPANNDDDDDNNNELQSMIGVKRT